MYIKLKEKKIDIYYYNTFFKKLIGLMFKKQITFGIYFKTKGIHTFFMKKAIDLCVVDKSNKIIYLEESLTKNKLRYFKNAKYIYELPLGSVKFLEVGKKINVISDDTKH